MWKQFEFWCEGVFFSGLGIFGIVANFASIITFLSPEVRIIVSVTIVITVIIVIFLCSWNWSPRWGSKHSTSYWLVSPFVKSCEFFHLIYINALFSVPNTVLGRKYRNLLKLNFSFLANVKSKPTFSPFHQSWIKASN